MSILSDSEITQHCLLRTTDFTMHFNNGGGKKVTLTCFDFAKRLTQLQHHLEVDEEILKAADIANIVLVTGAPAGEKIMNPALGVEWFIKKESNEMISPFHSSSISVNEQGKKIPSYGVSSYGYDVRLSRNFKRFKPRFDFPIGSLASVSVDGGRVIDTIDFDPDIMEDISDVDSIIMPPHSFLLGSTIEKVRVPRTIAVTCMGKSTIARMGLHAVITPLEPEWYGHITIELANMTHLPLRVHAGIGIMQLLFLQADRVCSVSYADRKGKYQDQAAMPIAPRL